MHDETLAVTTPTTNDDSLPSPLTGGVLANMLLGEDEFVEPMNLLGDLTPLQAVAKPAPHLESIAQIVAHMKYWQDYSLSIIRGHKQPYPGTDTEKTATWRDVEEGDWHALSSEFFGGLDAFMALTENDSEIGRQLEDDETVGDRIRWAAVHNAYHYGQIVLLRRMLGAWPPANEAG